MAPPTLLRVRVVWPATGEGGWLAVRERQPPPFPGEATGRIASRSENGPASRRQTAASPPAFPALSRTLSAADCADDLLENDWPEAATLSEDRQARHRYAPEASR